MSPRSTTTWGRHITGRKTGTKLPSPTAALCSSIPIFSNVLRELGSLPNCRHLRNAPALSILIAKLYARQGDSDHALQYLRRAMEEGYPGIDDVYKDADFEGLRKDARFAQLMASRPPAIPE